MKRSEMVKVLMSNSKVSLEEPVASYLLRLIEIKGMTPPEERWNKECCDYCGTTLPDKLSTSIGDNEFCGWKCAAGWEQWNE